MSHLVNLTPHPLRVFSATDEPVLDLPGNPAPARRVETTALAGALPIAVADIPLVTMTFGQVIDLPQPAPDTYYIVSRLVADACPDRTDLLVPAALVRDTDGRPIGCRAFAVGTAH